MLISIWSDRPGDDKQFIADCLFIAPPYAPMHCYMPLLSDYVITFFVKLNICSNANVCYWD
jgi:hypothetical protein